jgi:hypothetical protein
VWRVGRQVERVREVELVAIIVVVDRADDRHRRRGDGRGGGGCCDGASDSSLCDGCGGSVRRRAREQ